MINGIHSQYMSASPAGVPWQQQRKRAAASTAPQTRPRSVSSAAARSLQAMRRIWCAAAAAEANNTAAPRGPTHLVVFVNGLTGAPSNWDFTRELLQRRLPSHLAADMLLHASEVNAYLATWGGVDGCGQRLVEEVRGVVARNPQLKRISFVAHSMGGLISRYAMGTMYDPRAQTIAGLKPAHFITLATPHLGCDSDGEAAVPFIDWTGALPFVGAPLQGLLQGIAHTAGALLLARTGEQFFLLDCATPETPLLVQMTQDVPERGQYFLSALSSFATRTAYANADGDHLVGHANSSLRPLSGLPALPPDATRAARGVVLEDPLSSAFYPTAWEQLHGVYAGSVAYGTEAAAGQQSSPEGWHTLRGSSSGPDSTGGSEDWSADSGAASGAWGGQQAQSNGSSLSAAEAEASAASDLRSGLESSGKGGPPPKDIRAQSVAIMLARLCTLPWRRIDVSFGGATWGFAHNNIQVTRRILNFQGEAVPRHLADQLAAMEGILAADKRGGQPTASDSSETTENVGVQSI